MTREPTTDEIFETICADSAVPLSEVKKYPHGAIFEDARETVKARDVACTARLELADAVMLEQLAQVRAENPFARRRTGPDFPFQFICRRMQNATNSAPRPDGILPTRYNPLWMHPDDMEQLRLQGGDAIEIRSRHGAIPGFVQADHTLRRGVVAMAHGFGPRPGHDYDPRRDGSNVNLLVSWDDDPDPYHGMPRMSAFPVAIAAVAGVS